MDNKLSIIAIILSLITISIYITSELKDSKFTTEMNKIVSEKLDIIKIIERKKVETVRIDAGLLEQIDSINSILSQMQSRNADLSNKLRENYIRSKSIRDEIGSK